MPLTFQTHLSSTFPHPSPAQNTSLFLYGFLSSYLTRYLKHSQSHSVSFLSHTTLCNTLAHNPSLFSNTQSQITLIQSSLKTHFPATLSLNHTLTQSSSFSHKQSQPHPNTVFFLLSQTISNPSKVPVFFLLLQSQIPASHAIFFQLSVQSDITLNQGQPSSFSHYKILSLSLDGKPFLLHPTTISSHPLFA